jgi:hypothetical protein
MLFLRWKKFFIFFLQRLNGQLIDSATVASSQIQLTRTSAELVAAAFPLVNRPVDVLGRGVDQNGGDFESPSRFPNRVLHGWDQRDGGVL